ncbi:MAG: UvrB/UvrC motif-containing protein [Phycisphaerae bacterium]
MLFQECMKCSRPALIHITEVADHGPPRKIIEIHLCLEHAIEAGLMGAPVLIGKTSADQSPKKHPPMDPDLAKLEELDAAERREDAVDSSMRCPTCDMTWAQFQKHGLLGCANDYTVFSEPLTDLIASMHERHTQHIGKIPPQSSSADTIARAKLIQLQVQLNAAVQEERYEEAARLRDQLRIMAEPEA